MADRLAHFASRDRDIGLVMGEAPVFIQDAIIEDLNYCNVDLSTAAMSPQINQNLNNTNVGVGTSY